MQVYEAMFALRDYSGPEAIAKWLVTKWCGERGGDWFAELPIGLENEVRYAGIPLMREHEIAKPCGFRWKSARDDEDELDLDDLCPEVNVVRFRRRVSAKGKRKDAVGSVGIRKTKGEGMEAKETAKRVRAEDRERAQEAELLYFAAKGYLSDARTRESPELEKAGLKCLLQAAAMGHEKAVLQAAYEFVNGGVWTPPQPQKALPFLRKLVLEDGDKEAEACLAQVLHPDGGMDLAEGLWGAARTLWHERGDARCAFRLMESAAKLKHVFAMQDLAVMLREGIGCRKDRERALRVERQAKNLAAK